MKSKQFMTAALCITAALLGGCGIPQGEAPKEEAAYDVVDAQGTVVHIPHKPERILSGNMTYDTILLGLTTPDHVVAVNVLSKDPLSSFSAEAAKKVQRTTTSLTGISTTLVMEAKPDLILMPDYTDKNTLDMLRSLGYPVVVCRGPNTFEEIRGVIRLMAEAMGEKERGEKVVAEMDENLREADEVLSKIQDPRPAGLLVSQMQSYGGVGSMYDLLIRRARIDNAITKAGLKNGDYLSKEMVLKSDPDFFLVSATRNQDLYGGNRFTQEFFSDPALQWLKGSRKVIALPNRYIYCGNQDCGWAVKALANAAYGPLFDMSGEHHITAVE